MTRRERFFFLQRWFLSRLPFVLGFASFFVLIAGISFLFSIERDLVAYSLLVLTFVVFLMFAVDLALEWQRFVKVWQGEFSGNASASQLLLQERLEFLTEEVKRLQEEERERQADFQDYYTLWAHQIKVPLAASQLLVADLPADASKQALEGELFKIEQYTGLVLNYLRLQSFHEDLVIQREELSDLVRQAVKKFAIFFIQQGIELRLENLDYTFATDKKWFLLLLEQFISNAVKYTKAGRIRIFMEGENLLIQDTGIGIAQSDMERIFARGFSGYNGRLTEQSSGLGLYLSQQIARKLGLSFTLSSQLGVGTQVRICLKEERLVLD